MKKTLLTISSRVLATSLLGAFGVMVIATPAFAATNILFTPVNVSAQQGQTFTLTVGVNPQGAKNYTAKIELRYSVDLLEIKSFTFANGWMPLSQSGYDLTDNTNGVFIKTAGYPGGVSSPVTFGTVSFFTKKSGNGIIALNNNSFALDVNNQNVLTDASVQTVVVISAPTPTQTTPKAPTTQTTPVVKPTEEVSVLGEETPIVLGLTTASQPIASQFMLAAVGSIVTLGTDNTIVGLLIIAVILALAGYAIYTIIQKIRHKNFGK